MVEHRRLVDLAPLIDGRIGWLLRTTDAAVIVGENGEAAHRHRVDLDRLEPGPPRGLDALEHLLDAAESDTAPREELKLGKYNRVEATVLQSASLEIWRWFALAALAVLLVLATHARLGLPAGYLGVDIFFVISGYLITGMVGRAVDVGGFRFGAFYFRRAKRLFLTPAARPLLTRLDKLTSEIMERTLIGVDRNAVEAMTNQLAAIKENVRQAISERAAGESAQDKMEERYG